jgi:hypothetical protein
MLTEFYRATSACTLSRRPNMVQTLQNALYDALYGIDGKAGFYLPADKPIPDELLKVKPIKRIKHIFDEESYSCEFIYMDDYKNVILDAEGRKFCEVFDIMCKHFIDTNISFVYQRLNVLRNVLESIMPMSGRTLRS